LLGNSNQNKTGQVGSSFVSLGNSNQNAEVTDSEFDGDEDSGAIPSSGDKEKPTRPWNGRADWRLIKAWNISPTQTQPVEDSRQECFVLSRKIYG
jgi:hypothetical protein